MLNLLATLILPDGNVLELEEINPEGNPGVLKVHIRLPAPAFCPLCLQPSQREHSRYDRIVADLAVTGKCLQLKLEVRRLFCDNDNCKRCTFAERFPTFLNPYARKTRRLAFQQRQIGLALGGEAGARELQTLGMPLSSDTLLRLVKTLPVEKAPPPRVIGIDDWAWRKGLRYGTILVDLERHQVIDLLPDRSVENISAWLQAHPEVEIVSRDRGAEYIEGVSLGAPTAIQVADRWHLMRNLKDTLEHLLEQNRVCLTAAGNGPVSLAPNLVPSESETLSSPPLLLKTEQRKQVTREKRLTRYEEVVELRKQGLTLKEIVHQLGIAMGTVRRYLKSEGFPEMARRRKKPSLLDPYLSYLEQRWQAGYHNGTGLYREILKRGYQGSRTLLSGWAARKRKQDDPIPAPSGSSPILSILRSPVPHPWSVHRAVWLLLDDPQSLMPERKAALDRMLEVSPVVRQAYHFGQTFLRIVRERFSKALESWIKAVKTYEIPELSSFARSLSWDKAAITAALELPWSNGQTEGQVNRLKMIKRQMYGRAGFELLRARVIGNPTA